MDKGFGQVIKKMREEQGITQSELGKKVGLGQERISRIESMKSSASIDEACELAEYFNISLDFMVENKIKDLSKSKDIPDVEHLDVATADLLKGNLERALDQLQKKEKTSKNKSAQKKCQMFIANTLFWMANFNDCIDYSNKILNDNNPDYNDTSYILCAMFKILSLSFMGKQKEAEKLLKNIKDELSGARGIHNAIFLQLMCWLKHIQGKHEECADFSKKLIHSSEQNDFKIYTGVGLLFEGYSLGMMEDTILGIEKVKKGWTILKSCNALVVKPMYLYLLSSLYMRAKSDTQFILCVDEGIDYCENPSTKNILYLADLYTIKKEFLEQSVPSKINQQNIEKYKNKIHQLVKTNNFSPSYVEEKDVSVNSS